MFALHAKGRGFEPLGEQKGACRSSVLFFHGGMFVLAGSGEPIPGLSLRTRMLFLGIRLVPRGLHGRRGCGLRVVGNLRAQGYMGECSMAGRNGATGAVELRPLFLGGSCSCEHQPHPSTAVHPIGHFDRLAFIHLPLPLPHAYYRPPHPLCSSVLSTSHPASPQVLPPPWDIVLPALAKAGLPILDPQYSALLERHCGPGLNYAGTWGSFVYHLSFDGLHLIQSIHLGCGRRGQFRTPHQDGPLQRAPRVRRISWPAHLEVECSRAGRVIRPIGGKATGSWVGRGVRHMYSFTEYQ